MPNIQLEILAHDGKEYVTLTAYNELKQDLIAANEDIRQLRSNHAVLDSEIADICRIRNEHLDMKNQLDQITLFVRDRYAEEIGLGQHNNMRTISEVAIFYMGKERMMGKDK